MSKKIFILFSAILFSTLLISLASAAMISPEASATLSGTATLNASGTNLLNCTWYAKSASTANSSWTTIGVYENSSDSAASINSTFNSIIIEDASDYIFNATCRDTVNAMTSVTRTGITIDNTVPTAQHHFHLQIIQLLRPQGVKLSLLL